MSAQPEQDQPQSGGKESLPPARRSRRVHRPTSEIAQTACRFIRAIGHRVAGEDEDALRHLQQLDDELAGAWRIAIDGLRHAGYSDRDIGEELGITRQAVEQRWPRNTQLGERTP